MANETPPDSGPVIEVEDVHVAFGEKQVLRGVSVSVRRGETIALMAESGGGKTVLLRVMLGLLKPDRGGVRLFGTDVAGLEDEEMEPIRRRIGVVYQAGALYSGLSVRENIALELREVLKLPGKEIEDRVRRSLDAVGLGEVDPDLVPDELSGGMKKRLAVARAIAPEPEVIFYDEPTSGLDPINSARILALIAELRSSYGVTSLVVTHDVRGAMAVCSRLILMSDGKIGFDGTPAQFAESKDRVVLDFVSAAPGFAQVEALRPAAAARGRTPPSGSRPPGESGAAPPDSRKLQRSASRGGTPAARPPKEGTS